MEDDEGELQARQQNQIELHLNEDSADAGGVQHLVDEIGDHLGRVCFRLGGGPVD